MAICSKCGNEVNDGGLFCDKCGNKLEKLCPSCGASVPANANFCNGCGANLSSKSETNKSNDGGNVIAGDVSGSYNTSYNTSVVNNIYNTTVDFDVACDICKKFIPAAQKNVLQCTRCGKHFCTDHMNTRTRLCHTCSTEEKENHLDAAKLALRHHVYDEALAHLRKAVGESPDDSDAYYYVAIALLGGKKAFVQQNATIEKVMAFLDKAIAIRSKGIYYYLLAYIKYDYHERKCFKVIPDYKNDLSMARYNGVTPREITEMYAMLNVARVQEL